MARFCASRTSNLLVIVVILIMLGVALRDRAPRPRFDLSPGGTDAIIDVFKRPGPWQIQRPIPIDDDPPPAAPPTDSPYFDPEIDPITPVLPNDLLPGENLEDKGKAPPAAAPPAPDAVEPTVPDVPAAEPKIPGEGGPEKVEGAPKPPADAPPPVPPTETLAKPPAEPPAAPPAEPPKPAAVAPAPDQGSESPLKGITAKAAITKTVVMGRTVEENTDWVAEHVPEWQSAIYVVDLPAGEVSPTGLRTRKNKAHEAMPYLTYIVDHYENFTDVVAFIHSHRNEMPFSWHTDARNNDAKYMLQDLQLETVMKKGYVNLRCVTEEPGCPDEVQPYRNPPDPSKHAEHAFPFLYAAFFEIPQSQVKSKIEVVATPCCAQFAVSKAQLLAHPKTFYERILRTLEETTYDDATSGRVMEYMWHMIFGRDAVYCPNLFDCYCEVYGRCRLRPGKAGKSDPRFKADVHG